MLTHSHHRLNGQPDPAAPATGNGHTPAEPVQVKGFAITYDRKFNLGDYASLHPAITIWVRTALPEGALLDLHGCRQRVRDMAREELDELEPKQTALEETIRIQLLPKDTEDAKPAVVEIRAGTGGDEAGIFAGDLFRMYQRYCDDMRWPISVVDETEGTAGGYSKIIFEVPHPGTYGV